MYIVHKQKSHLDRNYSVPERVIATLYTCMNHNDSRYAETY